jgi:hypothetical protein
MLSRFTLPIRDLFASNAASVTGAPPPGEFVKGINLGGGSVTVEGQRWESYETALKQGLAIANQGTTITTTIIPTPYAPPDLRRMLNSVICYPETLELTQMLANGSYEVYLWILENYKTDWHSMSVQINGQPVATEVGKLPFGHWVRYGAYHAQVTDNLLTVTLSTGTPTVDAHLMGLSIFRR